MVGCRWWWGNILKFTIQRLQKMIDPNPKRFDVQGIGTTSSQTGGGWLVAGTTYIEQRTMSEKFFCGVFIVQLRYRP
jgi:hypothetical protein